MTRVWNTPIFALATVYFVIDGAFSFITRPLTAWLSKKRFLERLRRWVTSLGPYPSLALFAVPVIVLEPAKPLSAYLIATGHFFPGAVVFIAAEVLKLTVVERLFQLNKKKLLSIPAFAWGYGYWRRMMDFLELTKAWQAARRMATQAADWVRAIRSRLRQRHSDVMHRRNYSITSSARASSEGESSRPSALAAFRLPRRTSPAAGETAAKCQYRICTSSFDHLIGAGNHRCWHLDT